MAGGIDPETLLRQTASVKPRWSRAIIVTLLSSAVLHADDIDDYAKTAMAREHIPGVAIAVVKSGSVAKVSGYGLADIEQNVPVRPETVFKIGSASKQFIAAGIMLLAQDGRLGVDDLAGKYIPGLPPTWQKITLRHLLTHTSGLMREAPGFDAYKTLRDLDVIRTAFSRPLLTPTGTKYEYSNLGYYVLAEVISRVSGKPWHEFISERIFAPLGMTNTRITSSTDIVPNRAYGYVWANERFQKAEDFIAVRPSGAFLSTVLDLAKWEAALRTNTILTAASKAAMWTPATLADGKKVPYGFGWDLADFPADKPPTGIAMIRHEGTMPGFKSAFARWPGYDLAVIVLTNRNEAPVEAFEANLALLSSPDLAAALLKFAIK